MINTESFSSILFLHSYIFITTFNLAGAIIILQLDKKEQAKSLISLGFPLSHLRKTYFYTRNYNCCFRSGIRIILGSALCLFQQYTEFFKAVADVPFPVKIVVENYFIVAAYPLQYSEFSISWFFSKLSKDYITKS